MATYISEFCIKGLWNRYDLVWDNINPDVNIVVGINGAGKTTLLENIYRQQEKYGNCIFIRSIDNIANRDKRRVDNALTQELEYFVYDTKTGPSLMKRRADAYDYASTSADKVKEEETGFFQILNDLFEQTHKSVSLMASKNPVVIDDSRLPLNILSSGEKQLMIILLRVFLSKDEKAIVLIDEPENSLHIRWQRQLIDILVKMNPNAQYIITTHSPSLFGAGWGDKVVYMDDLMHRKND